MFEKIPELIMKPETVEHIGKTEDIVGMSMGTSGGCSSIGDIVLIYSKEQNRQMPAEVIDLRDERIQLMTYEVIGGAVSDSFVRSTKRHLEVPARDFLKGRITSAMERPIDGRNTFHANQHYTVNSPYTNLLDRPPICDRLKFEIKAIDGLNTIGKEQRIRVFAGSGVGKNTSMSMIAKNVKMDVSTIALMGERGREVLEFTQKDLGEEGMKRSVLVVVTSDQPATLRMRYPLVATAIVEYSRDQGFDVLLVMDSPIRYAMAQKEIGLAIGGPSVARGYTPFIYAEFPKLLERSDSFSQGSITGVYTVPVEGGDTDEPITDTVRGISDRHIVLSRQLADRNHFPAIDIGASISRPMVEIIGEEHCRISSRSCDMPSLYQKNSDLTSISAYKKGTDAALDKAVSKINKMDTFLQQGIDERFSHEETLGLMESIVG